MARKITATGTIPILDPDPNDYIYFTLTDARLAELGNPSYIIVKSRSNLSRLRIRNNTSQKILVKSLLDINIASAQYSPPWSEFAIVGTGSVFIDALDYQGGILIIL